jgi:cutinase
VITGFALVAPVITTPVAAAVSCPDVEVVFARGTMDRAGVGSVGTTFIQTLKWKLSGKKVSSYGVDYPASWDFMKSTSQGAVDANKHVQYTAGMCPDTKIVLGGISQGAGVIDLIAMGNRKLWLFSPVPLPDAMVGHVAAIAVFGNPSRDYATLGSLSEISPQYGQKTIDLCAVGDPYCSNGHDFLAHLSYPLNGMVNEAANFVARKVLGRDT